MTKTWDSLQDPLGPDVEETLHTIVPSDRTPLRLLSGSFSLCSITDSFTPAQIPGDEWCCQFSPTFPYRSRVVDAERLH